MNKTKSLLLTPGLHKVSHPGRKTPFMLSVIADRHFGMVKGVHGFEIGDNPPVAAKHLLLTNEAVSLWLTELREVA